VALEYKLPEDGGGYEGLLDHFCGEVGWDIHIYMTGVLTDMLFYKILMAYLNLAIHPPSAQLRNSSVTRVLLPASCSRHTFPLEPQKDLPYRHP
jgi:hypothetical protein